MPAPVSGPCCAHDHDCEASDCGSAWSLHKHVDLARVRCLNEAVDGTAKAVFKSWDKRLDFGPRPLRSNDEDPELLIHIPFDGSVIIRAICIIGGGDGCSPSEIRAFINRDDLDFSSVAAMPPVQRWELAENLRGELEYPVQVAKFNGVHSLDLHVPANYGAPETVIHFIGLKGDFTERKRQAVEAVYELNPIPDDTRVSGGPQATFFDGSVK